jgi:hypothetical protein
MKQRIPRHYTEDEWVSPNNLKWIWYRLKRNLLSFKRGMTDFYNWVNNSWIRSFLFVWTTMYLVTLIIYQAYLLVCKVV